MKRKLPVLVLITLIVGVILILLIKQSPKTISVNSLSVSDKISKSSPQYFFPMTKYEQRITVREYGRLVGPNDHHSLPCGDQFEGFHTADDLEATSEEINSEVPVFAIAKGKVVQIEAVEGYGGLVIIEHELEGKIVTAYYGHVDLSSVKVTKDDPIKGGERIANLGEHCTAETSFERKHLHFGIHADNSIDVRGYVSTKDDLAQWLNPKEFLLKLKANQPAIEMARR